MGKRFGVAIIALVLSCAASSLSQAQTNPPTIKAVIRLKGQVPMDSLAREIQDPLSPRYQKFYTPAEIRAVAGPSDADYQAALAQLRASGLDILSESPTHLWVSVEGPALALKNIQGKMVAGVVGLDKSHVAAPGIHRKAAEAAGGAGEPNTGIPQAKIKSTYGFDPIYQAGITGRGQDIAIATYNSFFMGDVKRFFADSHLPATPNVDVVEFNGMPSYLWGTAGETEMDVEFAGMIAPGANIHVFPSATNDDTGEAQLFNAILDDGRSHIVSYSWGDCETNMSAGFVQEMSVIFSRAVAQGVNIFVSSGDDGSDSCGNGTLVAEFPSSNPNVISVGGTSFLNGPVRHETAWTHGGGGISSIYDRPDFQGFLTAPFTKRAYPDVSFNSDPETGEAMFLTDQENRDGAYTVVGGTSMAVPHWAGLLALVAEAREKQNKGRIGYINPYLYGANSSDMEKIFVDITDGGNGTYNAGLGWDAVTGLGSPNASELMDYLLQK